MTSQLLVSDLQRSAAGQWMSFKQTRSLPPIASAAMGGVSGFCGWMGKSNCNGNRRSFDVRQDDSSLLILLTAKLTAKANGCA